MQHEIAVFEKNEPSDTRSDNAPRYYRLQWAGEGFWLANQAGEGMGLSEKNLFDILDAHFQSEF